MSYRDKIPKNIDQIECAVVDLTPEELAEAFADLAAYRAAVQSVAPLPRGRGRRKA